MAHINIEFTLFSAFYSPLISLMSGGFLKAEGLEADWTVSAPGVSAVRALEEGRADVIQSAPSQAFTTLAQGKVPTAIHFAQINEMDGFFITGRAPDPNFHWKRLEGSEVILFGGGQPLAMFKYACHKAGIDFAKLKVIGLGSAEEMDKAFRNGKGQYVQQQGPFPQQLEADGVGHIVARCGPKIGPVAFSSLAATRDWMQSDVAQAFMRAYTKTRAYMVATPAIDIAKAEKSFFPSIELDVLAQCISSYQQLGCWTAHVEITRPAFEVALDVFEHFGSLKERYAYDQVCAPPPSEG
jgi:NitT/TauT family transport system substrate-binding protein